MGERARAPGARFRAPLGSLLERLKTCSANFVLEKTKLRRFLQETLTQSCCNNDLENLEFGLSTLCKLCTAVTAV